MPTISDLKARISIDGAEKAKKDLKELKGGSGSSGGSGILDLASSFKMGLGAVTGFFAGFGAISIATDALGFLKDQMFDVLKAGMDQQKVQAQTAAVIASTGGAAHVSASQVGDYADALARMSGISDDTIQGSENLLLTFRAVGKDIFPQATKTILDMSVAMHEDLQSATIQVGKALQDPIHGVTTLQRVGVQLNDSQKTLIATYMKHNQVAKAQGVILNELTKEFGGSAEAAGKTLPGQLARLNVAWDQAKEKIGLAVIPILQSLVEKYLMPAADWLGKHLPAAIDTLTGFIDNTLMPAVEGFMNSPFVKTIEGWATSLADKLDPAIDTTSGKATNAKGGVDSFKTSLDNAGTAADDPNFKKHVSRATDELDRMVNKISNGSPNTAVIPALDAYDDRLMRAQKAQAKANQEASNSIPVLSGLGDAFGNLFDKVGQVKDAMGQFASGVGQRFGPAQPAINAILQDVLGDFDTFQQGIHDLWDGLWGSLTFPVRLAWDTVTGIINIGLDLFAGNMDKAKQDIANTGLNILSDIGGFKDSLLGILTGIGELVLSRLVGPFQQAKDLLDQILGQASNNGAGQGVLNAVNTAIANGSPGQGVSDAVNRATGGPRRAPGNRRADGGPTSGWFEGAERGMELLVTPGLYYAPPNSYVYNNSETRRMLSGNGNASAATTNTYHFAPGSIVIQGSNKSAGQLFDEMQREIDFRRRGHGR